MTVSIWRPLAFFSSAALAFACSSDGGVGTLTTPQGVGPDAGSSSGGSSSGGSSGSSSGGSHGSSGSSGSGSGSGGSGSGSGGSGSGSSGGSGGTNAADGGASSSGGGADAGDPIAAARAQCVQIINQYRATLSPPSPPLTEATDEESCVDSQAQKDYAANTAHSAFGQCSESAQDECPGWPGPPSTLTTNCLAQMWAEGPPPSGQDNHWLNMSNSSYTKVACGFYQTPKGDWWADQDFY